MRTNLDKEWKFITSKIHGKKPTKSNLLERETLFVLEILLCKINMKMKTYLDLKKLYLKKKC